MCANCYATIAAWERIKLRFNRNAPRPALRLAKCEVCGQPNAEVCQKQGGQDAFTPQTVTP